MPHHRHTDLHPSLPQLPQIAFGDILRPTIRMMYCRRRVLR